MGIEGSLMIGTLAESGPTAFAFGETMFQLFLPQRPDFKADRFLPII